MLLLLFFKCIINGKFSTQQNIWKAAEYRRKEKLFRVLADTWFLFFFTSHIVFKIAYLDFFPKES